MVQDSQGGITTSVYDALDQKTSEKVTTGGMSGTSLRFDYTYDATGNMTSLTRYSNLTGTTVVGTMVYQYDADERLSAIKQKNSTNSILAYYTYTYDLADRLTSKDENGTTTSLSYDAANQLTVSGTATFGYDATGNQSNAGDVTGTGNELSTDGTYTYTYDANGNVIQQTQGASGPTWVYTYNNANQLTGASYSATLGGTVTEMATYSYDAFGNRIESDDWNGTTTTVSRVGLDAWATAEPQGIGNENFNVWANLNGSNTFLSRQLSGTEFAQPIAGITSSSSVFWYLTDNEGSVRMVIDNSDTVLASVSYSAYGAITSGSLYDAYGYTGERIDSLTGLYANGNGTRDYRPSNGTWEEADPLFPLTGTNPYEYADDSPTNLKDPSGLESGGNGYTGSMAVYQAYMSGASSDYSTASAEWWAYSTFRAQQIAQGVNPVVPYLPMPTNTSGGGSSKSTWDWLGDELDMIGDYVGSNPLGALQEVGQGLRDGTVIVGNRLTFGWSSSLSAESQKLIAQNGGLYQTSDFLGRVAATALITAGGGSLAKLAGVNPLQLVIGGGSFFGGATLQQYGHWSQQYQSNPLAASAQYAPWISAGGAVIAGFGGGVLLAPMLGALTAASPLAGKLAVGGLIGFGVGSTTAQLSNEWDNLTAAKLVEIFGPWLGGALGAKLSGYLKIPSPCFAAGTPLQTPTGAKSIEDLKPGELVLSRDERDASGPVEAKLVEAVFVRTGLVCELRIGGQVVRTTGEHPFFSREKGWTQANELHVGDALLTMDGLWVSVEDIVDTQKWERVYNLRVADFHTYFIGCAEWGFSVWAHNSNICITAVTDANLIEQGFTQQVTVQGTTIPFKTPGAANEFKAQIESALAAEAKLGNLPGKASAATNSGQPSLSGWKLQAGFLDAEAATNAVLQLSEQMGQPLRPAGAFDQGVPGKYNASHAEKQQAVTNPNAPIAVSMPMCTDCIPWFQALAQYRGKAQIVVDPQFIRIFNTDGTITCIPR